MGSSSKKTTQNSTQTLTPNNPTWAINSLQGLNSRINALGQVDPSTYVAGPSDLQTSSYNAGANLGANSGLFGQAAGIASGVANGGPALNSGGVSADAAQLGDVSRYMNPYIKNVLDASNADADQNDARALGALKAQAAGSNAFGDTTYGIAQGQAIGDLARARQSANAGLLATGYNTAQGLNQYDTSNRQQTGLSNADRAQQAMLANQSAQQNDTSNKLAASGLLGNLGSASGSDARANATTQNALGQDERSIAQDQATAPISLAEAMAKLYGQNQFGLLQGQTSTGNSTTKSSGDSGLLGGLGAVLGAVPGIASGIGAAGAAAKGLSGLFSDVRLKTDICPLGRDGQGRNRYSWRYVWGAPGEGYLAQEVLKTDPQAVGEFAGFLTVDHTKMAGAPQWLA